MGKPGSLLQGLVALGVGENGNETRRAHGKYGLGHGRRHHRHRHLEQQGFAGHGRQLSGGLGYEV